MMNLDYISKCLCFKKAIKNILADYIELCPSGGNSYMLKTLYIIRQSKDSAVGLKKQKVGRRND